MIGTYVVVVGSYEGALQGYIISFTADSEFPEVVPRFATMAHDGQVRSLSAAPDGKSMCSASSDSTIKLFDLVSMSEEGSLHLHEGIVRTVRHVDETSFLSCGDDSKIVYWRNGPHGWEQIGELTGHKGAVEALAVHPTGTALLSITSTSSLRLWDLRSMTCKFRRNLNLKDVICLSWLPDGESFVVLASSALVVFSSEMKPITRLEETGLRSCVLIGSNYLAFGGNDGIISLVDTDSWKIVHKFPKQQSRIRSLTSHRDNLLVCGCSDGVVCVWVLANKTSGVHTSLVAKFATNSRCMDVCVSEVK